MCCQSHAVCEGVTVGSAGSGCCAGHGVLIDPAEQHGVPRAVDRNTCVCVCVCLCVHTVWCGPVCRYCFDVVTSDVRGGGTDAAVSLELCGAAGSSAGPWVLDRPGAFCRGQVRLCFLRVGLLKGTLAACRTVPTTLCTQPVELASSKPQSKLPGCTAAASSSTSCVALCGHMRRSTASRLRVLACPAPLP